MSSNGMAAVTAQFEPISLAELNHRAALQTRADNKYFLPWQVFVDFTSILRRTHLVLAIDEQRAFTYDTQYFDTPELISYLAHVQGRRKRFKCRSRRYVDSGLCVFELKLKGGRGQTVKYKMPYTEAECGTVTPAAASFLEDRLSSTYNVVFREQMVPTVRTHYQRVTFAAVDSMERVTCDFNLAFARDDQWQGQMAPDFVLVEIKSERGRSKTDQLLWRMGVRPSSGSKYCLGLSLLRPELRSNPFQHQQRSYFVRDDALGVEQVSTRVLTSNAARTPAYALSPLPSTTAALAR